MEVHCQAEVGGGEDKTTELGHNNKRYLSNARVIKFKKTPVVQTFSRQGGARNSSEGVVFNGKTGC